jgi:hypothetical protein
MKKFTLLFPARNIVISLMTLVSVFCTLNPVFGQTSKDQAEKKYEIKAYPNPTTGHHVTFSISSPVATVTTGSITFTNLLGGSVPFEEKIQISSGTLEYKVDLPLEIAEGIYIARLCVEGTPVSTTKITIASAH